MQSGHSEIANLTHTLTNRKHSTLLGLKEFNHVCYMGLSDLEKEN